MRMCRTAARGARQAPIFEGYGEYLDPGCDMRGSEILRVQNGGRGPGSVGSAVTEERRFLAPAIEWARGLRKIGTSLVVTDVCACAAV
jgi:hypothetical protein